MSVYTAVTTEQLRSFLDHYHIGELIEFAGIAEGVENTNYRVTTFDGDYILTLFEHFNHTQVPYYLSLLTHLHRNGIPCPQPIAMKGGTLLGTLEDRPAVLFSFLEGKSPLSPGQDELSMLGEAMAKMHLALDTVEGIENSSQEPHQAAIESVLSISHKLNADDTVLYQDELNYQQGISREHLARGLIHGDLFRDNCLIGEDGISGLLDFYSASVDAYILDIAIAVSDWCRDDKNELRKSDVDTVLGAYQEVRQLDQNEQALWPDMLRLAAFRFWCSRLADQLQPRIYELNVEKDPQDYKQLLIFLRNNTELMHIQVKKKAC